MLKLDTQPRSHLPTDLVEVCIQYGICSVPLQALCLVCYKKWAVDCATNRVLVLKIDVFGKVKYNCRYS